MNFGQGIFGAAVACFCLAAAGQTTFTVTTSADAFLAAGSPDNPLGADLTGLNFGAAGTLVIAPANAVKGEFRSVIRFDLSGETNLFNSTYGSNWVISGISLELASNDGTDGVQPNNPIFNAISGGKFVIEWMADDSWIEGSGTPNLPTTDGVTFASLPNYLMTAHEILCTNTYSPPGDDVHVVWPLPLNHSLVANVMSGGDVSFYFCAADDQVSYLFNSNKYGRGNEPLINVTAIPLLKILSGQFTNNAFHLAGIGETNTQYMVQANADLSTTNWQTLGTVTADSSGMVQYDDIAFSNQVRRFYRLAK
jgi:hypothetical protein